MTSGSSFRTLFTRVEIATASLAPVVTIVQASTASPSGDRQKLHRPANPNGSPLLSRTMQGC